MEAVEEFRKQKPQSVEDCWTIAMESGLRWIIDQLNLETCKKVKLANLNKIRQNNIDSIETNVLCAIAIK